MSKPTYTNIAFGTAYFVAINVLIASIQMGIPLLLPLALLVTVFLIDVAAANIFNSPYVDRASKFNKVAVQTYTRNSLLGFWMSLGNYNQWVASYTFTPEKNDTLRDSTQINIIKPGKIMVTDSLSSLSAAKQKLIQEGLDMSCKRS